MSGFRKRLADMSFRMVNAFKNPQPLRFYKGNVVKFENDDSYQRIFNKNEYTEFIGVIIDIKPQELTMLYDSNMYDIQGCSKLYTYQNLNYELKDRISISDSVYFEILSIYSSIGYFTLVLKEFIWAT
ncbi:conserved hypothetical protein (plasmid) [Borreliella burgdorferi 29805]|uniref:DUF1506 family protein n=1 Tax=Borreliella burgdorferi TaxID=139 RepID=UPI00017F4764|nr:DUF1506 family protein [Borreliella burgdorferi]ACM10170.1 conserved hypothetical protein [Borreliella burgdorferi 72a]ACO38120.1 conserved hypothetical protein [Borreliella burgdorferi 29805]MCR8905318.1 DUF1506 family protein [Borreliella burgdorferi]MCR8906685.1 DUF1506 family protein [Borreliella burgdorferi]PRQ97823.1 DUF1506 domain-containing protein [Borreliella burgdorferi]